MVLTWMDLFLKAKGLLQNSQNVLYALEEYIFCTGAFLYAPYSFMLLSNNSFVINVYCPGEGGCGEKQCGKKTLPHWKGGGAVH